MVKCALEVREKIHIFKCEFADYPTLSEEAALVECHFSSPVTAGHTPTVLLRIPGPMPKFGDLSMANQKMKDAYCTVKVTVPTVPVTLPEVPVTVMV